MALVVEVVLEMTGWVLRNFWSCGGAGLELGPWGSSMACLWFVYGSFMGSFMIEW